MDTSVKPQQSLPGGSPNRGAGIDIGVGGVSVMAEAAITDCGEDAVAAADAVACVFDDEPLDAVRRLLRCLLFFLPIVLQDCEYDDSNKIQDSTEDRWYIRS